MWNKWFSSHSIHLSNFDLIIYIYRNSYSISYYWTYEYKIYAPSNKGSVEGHKIYLECILEWEDSWGTYAWMSASGLAITKIMFK